MASSKESYPDFKSFVLPRLHPAGVPFLGGFLLGTLILFWIWSPLGWIGTGLTTWCAYFFRNPDRVTPPGNGLVISPADGRVQSIGPQVPPKELGLGPDTMTRISVFMNVFNVHVNRIPVTGIIRDIQYRPGLFLNATLDKASVDNERNAMLIETEAGENLVVVQIAGLIARRIVCEVAVGDKVASGAPLGLIRFGSRLDVYLPPGFHSDVQLGQTMIAGETVLARKEIATSKDS
jgi:phosphatidylserine decarboxylase